MAEPAPLDLGIPGLEDAMLLGRGGFAVVYRAYQPAFRRTVAVKVVSVTHVDELTRERFRRECQAMGLLSEHPSIVTVLEAGFLDDGRPFLVMAYMPEGSLQDRLRQGPLGWQEATRIGVKLAGALGTAHQAGVLHRDVKPANILVSQYGEPQLADFGIARVAGGQETSSGVITASLSYAPPEIVDGQRPSVASDVYSLGATIHALMSGSAPFWKDREDSIAALLNRVMNSPPPDLVQQGVPANVAEVLEQAMAKDPQDRPASAAQFGRLLRLAEDENGLRPTQLTVYKPAVEPPPTPPIVEPPPTEMAPVAEDSGDFTDSPTDVVDTDEMLSATAAASSITESPPDEDAATDTIGQEVTDTPVTDPATVDLAEAPVAANPVAEESALAPTATVAAAAGLGAAPEATADLAGKHRVEEQPEPEKPDQRRVMWVAVAAVVAVFAVVAGYVFTRGGDNPEAATTSTFPGTSSAASAATPPSGGEFIPPTWWAEDPVLSQAVLLDSDSHDIRNYAQVRADGASVPERWEIGIPPNWSPNYDSGLMTIAVGRDEVDRSGSTSIDQKTVRRQPAREVAAFAAVLRISVAEPAAAFQFSLASTSEPHRGFGMQSLDDRGIGLFTVRDDGPEVSLDLESPISLEPGASYDLALIAKENGVLHFAVWPSENTSARWDEIAGVTVDLDDQWTLPDGWAADVNVFAGGSLSIDEYWAFELPAAADGQAASTFAFPEWWLADPDWSRAELVDHATHDQYNFVAGEPYGESVWYASESPDWGPGFADGMMYVATGRGETDYGGVPILSKRLWRSPTTAADEYAAVYRIMINELGDGIDMFLERAGADPGLRSISLAVESSGRASGFWYTDGDPNRAFDLDQPITLEPGVSYDVALISEGGGVFDLRVWPSGEAAPTLSDVAGIRLDLADTGAVSGGWIPGLAVLPGSSVSIDEYWGFELPAGDTAPDAIQVGMVFNHPGRGDQSFNEGAAAGLDRATTDLGIRGLEVVANQDGTDREELVRQQAEESDLVFGVGFTFADAIRAAAEAYPDTMFAIVDDASIDLPNVANLTFAEEEGSYLMGVAAGLKTSTLRVGFIGGVDWEPIQRFEAGFTAGVRGVDPAIAVDVEYISDDPDVSAFDDASAAQELARTMYEGGADVIYHAAGRSGEGVFQAAREHSEATGTKVWAIGVDSDQYLTAAEDVRPYILTSMMKRVDVAVYDTIQNHVAGTPHAGTVRWDLAVDGVAYATSGGFIDDIIDQLEVYKTQIINGNFQVPDTP